MSGLFLGIPLTLNGFHNFPASQIWTSLVEAVLAYIYWQMSFTIALKRMKELIAASLHRCKLLFKSICCEPLDVLPSGDASFLRDLDLLHITDHTFSILRSFLLRMMSDSFINGRDFF
jgi:hypothetical protein